MMLINAQEDLESKDEKEANFDTSPLEHADNREYAIDGEFLVVK